MNTINYLVPLIAVMVLSLIAYVLGPPVGMLFGFIIPIAAVFVFVGGFFYRVWKWSKIPVPFKIPTTCGQQKSLSWIEPNSIDNPTTKLGVLIRMALEILTFRSLFRNSRIAFNNTPTGVKISYHWEIFLWVAALAFHYSFLVVLIRHLRFFLELP